MTTRDEPHVTAIGQIANQVLWRSPSGLVTGKTSHGIYLQPSGDLTLYLTWEPFRSPLTVNIRGKSHLLAAIQIGELIELVDNRLKCIGTQQVILFQKPLIWRAPSPPRLKPRSPDSFARIIHQVQESYPGHPYLPLLDMVRTGEPFPIQNLPGLENQILQLSRSLQENSPPGIIAAMKGIMGAGPGLTPLGDDILLGTLLAVNRSGRHTNWPGDLIHFYHTLIQAAEEETTRLSWSLLSCATQGAGDERIIRVLDDLIAAREIPDHDLDSLLNWGSSSGIAVLAGIMMALF